MIPPEKKKKIQNFHHKQTQMNQKEIKRKEREITSPKRKIKVMEENPKERESKL